MAAAAPAPAPTRSRFATLVVVALVLALAWQLAHWTWVFLTPRAAPSAAPAEAGVDLALAARLFGGTAASSGASPATSASGLRLKGVVAPTPGETASAVFSTGAGRDRAVLLGSEVAPGVKLVEVHPDHAVVSRGGVRERVDLEVRRPGPAATAAAAKAGGFRMGVARSGTNSYSFSRKELDDALRDPAQLNQLGQIAPGPNGEVRLAAAPIGSLAWKLGLQPGDIIRRINGQAVASTGDLARLYQQFGTLSLVQAEVQRGSATVQLSYAIQQ